MKGTERMADAALSRQQDQARAEGGDLLEDAKAFSLRMIRLYRFLTRNERETVLPRQVLRSGTSIGANLAEAAFAQTRPDFITKMSTALKEASETAYWLEILQRSGFISTRQFNSLDADVRSLLARLVASVRTAKSRLGKEKEG